MPLTAPHPDSPGTRVHLTKRPRLLVFSVDRHTGSVQLLPILWPNMCLEHTATEVATEFQDAVTVRRSENRAVVRPLPLGAINVGAGGSSSSPLVPHSENFHLRHRRRRNLALVTLPRRRRPQHTGGKRPRPRTVPSAAVPSSSFFPVASSP
jgi:hypothetical protein